MKKFKEGLIDFLKDILGLALIIGVIYGAYQGFRIYKSNQAKSDESYKVVTSRDKSYNGVYSLTKLDENGKNTWCGLLLYVENDKVVSCIKGEAVPLSELREALGGRYKDIPNKELEWEACFRGTDEDREIVDKIRPRGKDLTLDVGFNGPAGDENYLFGWQGEFVSKGKINFDEVLDIKTTYDYMKSCDIVPGYDEKSQEVWLSKLLKNPQSVYHEGYKLIRYKNNSEFIKKCPLASLTDNLGLKKDLNVDF